LGVVGRVGSWEQTEMASLTLSALSLFGIN